MRPSGIELKKITNKLNTLIRFFHKELVGKEWNEHTILLGVNATSKALAHAERIGWIKGE